MTMIMGTGNYDRRSAARVRHSVPSSIEDVVADVRLNGAAPDAQETNEFIRATVNSLFAVGLDLASTQTLTDGPVAERIGRAVHDLDAIIVGLRSNGFSSRSEPSLPGADCLGPPSPFP